MKPARPHPIPPPRPSPWPDLGLPSPALAGPLVALALLLATVPARALDYDRNDVIGRELSLGFLLSPTDLRECPDGTRRFETKACKAAVPPTPVQPAGLVLRGTARRHQRWFYVATELQAGLLFPVADHGARPWLEVAGAAGAETAHDGYEKLRGYGELGVALLYAHTRLSDTLAFFAEGGMRYQVRTYERPHWLLHIGVRAMHNFSQLGLLVHAGLGFTFD